VLFQNLALTKSDGSMGSACLLSAVQQRINPGSLFFNLSFQPADSFNFPGFQK
jgi:hypothetical protein